MVKGDLAEVSQSIDGFQNKVRDNSFEYFFQQISCHNLKVVVLEIFCSRVDQGW